MQTKWKPHHLALVAVGGTVLAALIAASAALTVAMVNARASAALSRAQAIRDHRLKEVEPLTQLLEQKATEVQHLLFGIALNRKEMLTRAVTDLGLEAAREAASVSANLKLVGLSQEIEEAATKADEAMSDGITLASKFIPLLQRGEAVSTEDQREVAGAILSISESMKALRTAIDAYVFGG